MIAARKLTLVVAPHPQGTSFCWMENGKQLNDAEFCPVVMRADPKSKVVRDRTKAALAEVTTRGYCGHAVFRKR